MKKKFTLQLDNYRLITISIGLTTLFYIIGILIKLPFLVMGCTTLCAAFLFSFKLKYDSLVYLNLFLLSVVLFEPSPSDLLFLVLLILGMIKQVLDFKKVKSISFIILIFLAYFFTSIPGIVNSENSLSSLRYYIITFYLFVFAAFIFVYLNEKNYIPMIRIYVISTLFAAMSGILGYLGFFSDVLLLYSDRAKGLFKDPNVFGPFLVPTVIIMLNDLTEKKIFKGNRLVELGIILAVTLGIFLSFSRAAWINLGIAVLLYFILNYHKSKVLISVLFIVGVLSAGFFWFNLAHSQADNFLLQRAKLQDYDKERFATQLAGFELAYQNPLGYGPGQYETAVFRNTGNNTSAHSIYMRILVENGVLSFVLFFTALIYITIGLYFKHIRKTGKTCLNSSVLLSILIGLMINSLVIDTLHWRHMWLFIGFALFDLSNTESP